MNIFSIFGRICVLFLPDEAMEAIVMVMKRMIRSLFILLLLLLVECETRTDLLSFSLLTPYIPEVQVCL